MKSGNSSKSLSFYYITDPLLETVKDSQVINWLELLAEYNIHFQLIIPTPVLYFLKSYSLRERKLKETSNKISGKIIEIPILRKRDLSGISSIILTIVLIIIFLADVVRNKKIIIQTRNFNNLSSLQTIKCLSKRIKIIYEMRGAAAEEFLNSSGYSYKYEVRSKSILRKYTRILTRQFKMINLSERTICVSHKLMEYVSDINITVDKEKLLVIPGAADNRIFFFDDIIRTNLEKKCQSRTGLF